MARDGMPEPREILLSGQRISYFESAATGQAVVLVHGNSLSGRCFARQLASELGQKYRLIAPDLPGHGLSGPAANPATGYTLPGYAAVVTELIDRLGLQNPVLVGWSLGGHILLEAISRLPGAAGLMLLGTPPIAKPLAGEPFKPTPLSHCLFQNELSLEHATAVAAGFFTADCQVPELLIEDMLRTDGRAREALWQSVMDGNYSDEAEIVAHLARPLAIVHGKDDQLVNLVYIKSLSIPALWRGEVQVIESAGHVPHWEQPDRFNQLVMTFIEELHG